MSVLDLARREIRQLAPYEAAAQINDTVRLNANESPIAPAVGHFRRPLNRYPEVRPRALQKKLAARFGCDTDELLVTRGSSEAIDLLLRVFCRAGRDGILTPVPSFSMYRHYAVVQGATVIEVPTTAESDFAIDVDTLLAACEATTKLLFLCSPNNPTGAPLPRADLVRLLDARSGKSVIVVDEAYIEFGDTPTSIELLREYDNLVVLRTLSKALGFAGARCGAVVASRGVIRMLAAVQAPYAMATPVVECVEDALAADALAASEETIRDVISERARLADAMRSFRFVKKTWPSSANFFLVQVDDVSAFLEFCGQRRVLLRDVSNALPDCVRISVGSRADNELLLQVFTDYEAAA